MIHETDNLCAEQLREWVQADEKLLRSYERVLRAIPECPQHGPLCAPHAVEWIEETQSQLENMTQGNEVLSGERNKLLAVCDQMYDDIRVAHRLVTRVAKLDCVLCTADMLCKRHKAILAILDRWEKD